MLKNCKGITLIALVVTIIVLVILASVGTEVGLKVIEDSKYYNGISEMKLMQSKINEIYEDYKDSDAESKAVIESKGESIDSIRRKANMAYLSVSKNKKNNENIGTIGDYRYYKSDYITEELDLDGISRDFIVNIKTRTVMLLDGATQDGTTYYALCEIEDEQYNVEYTAN